MADRNMTITDKTGADIVNKIRALGGDSNIFVPSHLGRNPVLTDATGQKIVEALNGLSSNQNAATGSGAFTLEIHPSESMFPTQADPTARIIPNSQTAQYEIASSLNDFRAAIRDNRFVGVSGGLSGNIISSPLCIPSEDFENIENLRAFQFMFIDMGCYTLPNSLSPTYYYSQPSVLSMMGLISIDDDSYIPAAVAGNDSTPYLLFCMNAWQLAWYNQ